MRADSPFCTYCILAEDDALFTQYSIIHGGKTRGFKLVNSAEDETPHQNTHRTYVVQFYQTI